MEPTGNIINAAIKAADNVTLYRHKHGAIVYRGNHILSIGWNKQHRIPWLARYGYKRCLLHAETDAVIHMDPRNVRGSSLLVVRVSKGKLKNSKPCEHCMALIIERGIREVYYSDSSGEIQQIRVRR